MLKQILNDLSNDLRRRVTIVMDSKRVSLQELQTKLKYFDKYSDFSFTADSNSIYLIYNYIDQIDGECYTECVTLPDLFVENFEEFMKEQK